ncbi:MAG: antibiotic biosynthesis monooxygenase [Candidatus Bathyarchaeota archaeon]|jgi:quinol monooxygenase YgiN|nr:antibiotic biosynthesis monooxygenase [Candidatus Bathyarchaeota archaeon]
MIVIAAMITTLDDQSDAYQQAFQALAANVRKDPGVITYVLHRMIDNPSKFFIFEQYMDDEAIQYHTSTKHFKEYRKNTAHMVKERDVGFYHAAV